MRTNLLNRYLFVAGVLAFVVVQPCLGEEMVEISESEFAEIEQAYSGKIMIETKSGKDDSLNNGSRSHQSEKDLSATENKSKSETGEEYKGLGPRKLRQVTKNIYRVNGDYYSEEKGRVAFSITPEGLIAGVHIEEDTSDPVLNDLDGDFTEDNFPFPMFSGDTPNSRILVRSPRNIVVRQIVR